MKVPRRVSTRPVIFKRNYRFGLRCRLDEYDTFGQVIYVCDAENRQSSSASLSTTPTASKLKLDFACDSKGSRFQKLVSAHSGAICEAQ